MYVLDTDIVSYYQRGQIQLKGRVEALPFHQRCISVVTKMELLGGRFQSFRTALTPEDLVRAQQRLDETEAFLSWFRVLPLDESIAQVFSDLLRRKLGKLKRNDLLIASTAMGHKAILVTHNTKDFKRVPGLKLEDWTK